MALIKSQLVLTDQMSPILKTINKSIILVIDSMKSLQKGLGENIDFSGLDKAQQELRQLQRQIDSLNSKETGKKGIFGDLLKHDAFKTALRGIKDVVSTGINYASDLAEVQNVVDVTFGNSSRAVDSWAQQALNAYGMNEVSAKRYAGTMGAMLKSSGLAGDSVVNMSQDMVGLAGDMASFYNLDLETAFEKIRSGISGETEPLKQLGINMSVANLEAYALSQGITKSYDSMTQAEQVMLRYNYLMNTTSDAQGDFARTSDSWANQTRLLSESWTQFTGILAEQLLPVLTMVVTGLNNFLTFLSDNSETVSAVLLGLVVTVGILAAAWAVHAAAQAISTAATRLQTTANNALNKSLLANPILWIALIIGVLVAMIYKWVQSVGGITNAWNICKAALMVAWNAIKVAWYAVVYGVTWGVNKVLDFVDTLKLCWQKAGVAIANFMGDMKVSVLTILQNLINGAIDIINDFIGLLNKIPGVNIGLVEHVTFATTAAAENEAAKQARAESLAAYEADIAAGKAEREANLANAKANLDNATAELSASVTELSNLYAASKAAASESEDAVNEEIAENTESTAESAGSVAGSLKTANEDLKYLRDLAEQEAINRFTTAEVKIDMTGMTNRIDSSMDLDGVLNTFTAGFAEALEIAAEGVHA
nr:MAG TPA: minor tail protein [Caudoviricetes sp.]